MGISSIVSESTIDGLGKKDGERKVNKKKKTLLADILTIIFKMLAFKKRYDHYIQNIDRLTVMDRFFTFFNNGTVMIVILQIMQGHRLLPFHKL